MIIERIVEFDAAHRLTFHQGKCFNIHGHRWKVRITIEAATDEDMVLDFGDIKRSIVEKFDHKLLIYKEDKMLISFMDSTKFAYEVFEKETTAENMSIIIFNLISDKLTEVGLDDCMIEVQLWETPNSSVVFDG